MLPIQKHIFGALNLPCFSRQCFFNGFAKSCTPPTLKKYCFTQVKQYFFKIPGGGGFGAFGGDFGSILGALVHVFTGKWENVRFRGRSVYVVKCVGDLFFDHPQRLPGSDCGYFAKVLFYLSKSMVFDGRGGPKLHQKRVNGEDFGSTLELHFRFLFCFCFFCIEKLLKCWPPQKQVLGGF